MARDSLKPDDRVDREPSGTRETLVALGRLLRELDDHLSAGNDAEAIVVLEQVEASLAATSPMPMTLQERSQRLRELHELRSRLEKRAKAR